MRRVKRQNNAVFGHPSSDQFLGNAIFDAIVMYPYFIVADFCMDDDAVNPLRSIPAFLHEHIVIAIVAQRHRLQPLHIDREYWRDIAESFLGHHAIDRSAVSYL
jgi:hypothetical protein